MKVALFNVSNNLCGECSLPLRRLVVGMDGVESIDMVQGRIAVKFDETAIDEERLTKVTKDGIEMLVYRIEN